MKKSVCKEGQEDSSTTGQLDLSLKVVSIPINAVVSTSTERQFEGFFTFATLLFG